ncbi:MAG: lactate utilization protein C, partial [Acidimicrobiales bacterium]
MSDARELILTRVRNALGDAGAAEAAEAPAPRSYRRQGTLEPQARIELLCERIGDYQAEVRRVGAGA